MKSFALLALAVIIFMGQPSMNLACSNPGSCAEAEECRRDTCTDLVKRDSCHSNTGTTTGATSPSSAPTAPSVPASLPSSPASLPSSPSSLPSSPSSVPTVSSLPTISSLATLVSGATGVTGGPSTTASSGECPCKLIDALRNMTILLTAQQQVIFEQFIELIRITIIEDVTLTDEEKVVKCGYALKHFFSVNIDIEAIIQFQSIAGWGSCFDFTYVIVDLQIDIYESFITLDANGDCALFEALLNATSSDTQKHAATIVLIEELKAILEDVSWSQAKKMAKIYLIIQEFLKANPDWESFFLDIKIEGFGTFESFRDIAKGYYQSVTISNVLVGSSDADCPLLKGLSAAVANTSFSLSVRNQIKNFHDKCALYFASVTDVNLRIEYMSKQYWQLIIIEPWIVQYMSLISLNDLSGQSWGIFADLVWVQSICNITGSCGCMSCGVGNADCVYRPSLITVDAQNNTVLLSEILAEYKTWNTTTQLGFNNCKNQLIQAIYNNTAYPTVQSKVNAVNTAFKAYNTNNKVKQQILFNVTIDVWEGTCGNWVNCGNM